MFGASIGTVAIITAVAVLQVPSAFATVPVGCTGNPHDRDSSTGNPHDHSGTTSSGFEGGNPHDVGGHHDQA
jgi:hypothetical protein